MFTNSKCRIKSKKVDFKHFDSDKTQVSTRNWTKQALQRRGDVSKIISSLTSVFMFRKNDTSGTDKFLVDLYFPTLCTICTSSQHTLLICIQNSRWQACFYFMFTFLILRFRFRTGRSKYKVQVFASSLWVAWFKTRQGWKAVFGQLVKPFFLDIFPSVNPSLYSRYQSLKCMWMMILWRVMKLIFKYRHFRSLTPAPV